MKRIAVFLLVLSVIMVSPFMNYSDLEKNLFVTAVLIDKDGDNSYKIYYECFKPTTKTSSVAEGGDRVVIHSDCSNLADLYRKVNSKSSLRLTLSQNRVILFSKKMAMDGIDEIMDMFTHEKEFVIGSELAIWDNDPERIEDITLKGERFIGPYLTSQFKNINSDVSSSPLETVRQLYNDSAVGSEISLIPIVKVEHNLSGSRVDIIGSGVLKDYKLIETLNSSQIIDINFLKNNIKSTYIRAQHPDFLDKSVVLKVLNSKTTTKYSYTGSNFIVNKLVTVNCVFNGSEGKINLSNENIKKIQKSAEEDLTNQMNQLVIRYEKKGIDVLKIGEELYRYYPHQLKLDRLKNVQIPIKVKVTIDSTNDPKDFKS